MGVRIDGRRSDEEAEHLHDVFPPGARGKRGQDMSMVGSHCCSAMKCSSRRQRRMS